MNRSSGVRVSSGTPETGGRQTAWMAGLLLLLTVFVYLPALRAGYIWDDDSYVTESTVLRDLPGLKRIWTDVHATPQYYPLVHTAFWVEYRLWRLDPRGFHLVNVLLHAIAAILLWRVLAMLRLPGAWLGAAIFALHPVHVETVAWVTERKNVLSAVFYLAAALAYMRSPSWERTMRRSPGDAGPGDAPSTTLSRPERRRRARQSGEGGSGNPPSAIPHRPTSSWPFYFLSLALFVAALLSKTVAFSLPAALLLVIWWKRGKLGWGDILPLLPFFALGIGLIGLTAHLEKVRVGAYGFDFALTFWQRLLIAGRALWFYAGKLAWPTSLTFVYPRWQVNPAIVWLWLFPLAVAGVVAGLWLLRGRIGRGPLVGVLFFAGTLFPALGFVNVYPMRYSFVADHFQYMASVGLIALAAFGLSRLPGSWRAVPVVLLLILGLLTWRQTKAYRDAETLWRDTVAKNPAAFLAHNNLGTALFSRGRMAEAVEHYEQALEAKPDYVEAHYNLGNLLAPQGRLEEGIQHLERAVQLKPDFAEAHSNLGIFLAAQGNLEAAIEHYREALRLKPDLAHARAGLGLALASQGRVAEAVEELEQALSVAAAQGNATLVDTIRAQLGALQSALPQSQSP